MKRTFTAAAMAAAMLLGTATAAGAGGPTCENIFGTGWANHGEHVLTYVNGDGAAGGAPAHHSDGDGPAPGASFCLDQANSPGLHKSDF